MLGLGVAVIRRREHRGVAWMERWPRAFALSAAGSLAGLMFARNPDWTYAVAIDQLSHVAERTVDWPGLVAPVALFAGAVLGALMIPGGNDTLLLWWIPGITVYGFVAYAVMTGTIAATIWGMRR